jgi:hypothetical protein
VTTNCPELLRRAPVCAGNTGFAPEATLEHTPQHRTIVAKME